MKYRVYFVSGGCVDVVAASHEEAGEIAERLRPAEKVDEVRLVGYANRG